MNFPILQKNRYNFGSFQQWTATVVIWLLSFFKNIFKNIFSFHLRPEDIFINFRKREGDKDGGRERFERETSKHPSVTSGIPLSWHTPVRAN